MRVGERAPFDILSRVDFSFEDEDATRHARQQARLRTPNVYALNVENLDTLRKDLREGLSTLAASEAPRKAADKLFGKGTLTDDDTSALRATFSPNRKQATEWFLEVVLFPEIENLVFLPNDRYEIEQTRQKIRLKTPDGAFYDMRIGQVHSEKDAADVLRQLPKGTLRGSLLDWQVSLAAYGALVKILAPRLTGLHYFDDETSRQNALAAEQRIHPVIIRRDRKDILVNAGEVITDRHKALLLREQAAYHERHGGMRSNRFNGIAIIVVAGSAIMAVLARRSVKEGRLLPKHIWGLILIVACVLAARIAVQKGWTPYAIPVGLLSVLLTVAYGSGLALSASAMTAVMIGIAFGNSFAVAATYLAGSATAVIGARRIPNRLRLMLVGLTVGVAQFLTILAFALIANSPPLPQALWGLINGLVVGLLATGLLPLIERFLRISTSISLLELSDLNQPLLKELALAAPGTYNHSLIVGHLAEAAAKTVGADSLLTRVASYYHDIGKMSKPEYFVENRGPAQSKHVKLTPTMSTLVIIAHVKDGLELARTYRLPAAVKDIIMQHHGTTLVQYFYAEAQQANPRKKLNEEGFRYPGPRPHSKEAVIVMLADAVESASRAMSEPTPARIETMVRRICEMKLEDGQFQECDLSLGELHRIVQELSKTLASMFHSRVVYPGGVS